MGHLYRNRRDGTYEDVTERAGVGGHWREAYPFVRLHQASMFYGVASTVLSMVLGTLAALGLAQWKSRFKPLVLAFVLAECPHRRPGSAKLLVTALRSLLEVGDEGRTRLIRLRAALR